MDCHLDKFDQYIEGDLILRNVPKMNLWRNGQKLDMRIAFSQEIDPEFPVYDILKFEYTWSTLSKEEYKKPGRWVCTDGFVKDKNKLYVPNIWRSSRETDSF